MGALVSAEGVLASFYLDLPTGATIVAAFGVTLLLVAAVRLLFRGGSPNRVPAAAARERMAIGIEPRRPTPTGNRVGTPTSRRDMAMKWNPAPPEAVSAFAAATADVDGLERRKMFGYDAVFAHNRMVAGLHEVGMVLRLPDEDRERFVGRAPVEAVRGDGPGDARVRGRYPNRSTPTPRLSRDGCATASPTPRRCRRSRSRDRTRGTRRRQPANTKPRAAQTDATRRPRHRKRRDRRRPRPARQPRQATRRPGGCRPRRLQGAAPTEG